MRKENPARYSSAVGEAWMHCMFKVKYCHPLFEDEIYREGLRTLLIEAAYQYEIPLGEMGFDEDHVHFMADVCMYKRYEIAKLLKGYTAKKFFEYFPELKRSRRQGGKFWGSGLWNPSYYIASPEDLKRTINYIRKQKYGLLGNGKQEDIRTRQATLGSYAS